MYMDDATIGAICGNRWGINKFGTETMEAAERVRGGLDSLAKGAHSSQAPQASAI